MLSEELKAGRLHSPVMIRMRSTVVVMACQVLWIEQADQIAQETKLRLATLRRMVLMMISMHNNKQVTHVGVMIG